MVQQDFPKNHPIRTCGCYFLCLMWGTNNLYNDTKIADWIWYTAKDRKYIDNKNNIIKPDKLLYLMYRVISGRRLVQVGIESSGSKVFWGWVQNKRVDLRIRKVITTGPMGTHFVVVNDRGETVYDPYQCLYRIVKMEYEVLYQELDK